MEGLSGRYVAGQTRPAGWIGRNKVDRVLERAVLERAYMINKHLVPELIGCRRFCSHDREHDSENLQNKAS